MPECRVCNEGTVSMEQVCNVCGADHDELLDEYDAWQNEHELDTMLFNEV